ncbi:glycosyltransferase family 9 protein [Pontibacterium sp.]|uniref:glycosyltransferase family 9 protein n=1 Tax=Pontibacterium sp. TaxID=2036026 RepID=UPI0035131EC8
MEILKVFYLKAAYGYRRAVIACLKSLLFRKVDSPRKIVIHRVGAFGDSVVALPAIMLLRRFFHNARIDLVSTQAVGITIRDLIDGGDVVDNIYIFAKGDRHKALKLIREGGYDLYVEIPQNLNLIKSVRNMLYVRFVAGIPSAFGWDAGRIKRFLPIQKRSMRVPREVDRFLDALRKEGIEGQSEYPLAIKNKHKQKALALIPPTEKKRIALLIGGKLQAKKWPLERWKELSRALQTEAEVYLIGGPDEVEESNLISGTNSGVRNLCGKTSILETAAILSKMDLAISQDTGAMHLAYAVHTPLVSLFSTRDLSDKWHPPAASSVVLERVLPCSFCFRSECVNNVCMTGISVDEVLEAKAELERKLNT